jgi:hypothetical protein
MAGIKSQLAKGEVLSQYKSSIEKAWRTPWVVHCEPSLGKPEHVVGYLARLYGLSKNEGIIYS